jgi:hypothetical protein
MSKCLACDSTEVEVILEEDSLIVRNNIIEFMTRYRVCNGCGREFLDYSDIVFCEFNLKQAKQKAGVA